MSALTRSTDGVTSVLTRTQPDPPLLHTRAPLLFTNVTRNVELTKTAPELSALPKQTPLIRQTLRKQVRMHMLANSLTQPGNVYRIMLIDDEPGIRDVVKLMLEFHGHTVHTADSGQEGLDSIQSALEEREPFDMVIVDQVMPDLSGLDVAQSVATTAPNTCVILLTGAVLSPETMTQVRLCTDGVVCKPVGLDDLGHVVANAMNGTSLAA